MKNGILPIYQSMDSVTLLLVFLLSFSLGLVGARGLLGVVFQLMTAANGQERDVEARSETWS